MGGGAGGREAAAAAERISLKQQQKFPFPGSRRSIQGYIL